MEAFKPLRHNFPKEECENYDGWIYTVIFSGETACEAYDELKEFLIINGYTDIPIPADLDEFSVFSQDDAPVYRHNPITISFSASQENVLRLNLFNEKAPNHLLMFHGVYDAEKMRQLKESRAQSAIRFIEEKIANRKEPNIDFTLPELQEKIGLLLQLKIDKNTILSVLFHEALRNDLLSYHEIMVEFGQNIADGVKAIDFNVL